jgi:hypothetical protein
MYSDIVGGGLTVLNQAGNLLRRGAGSDSLVDFTSVGRVEPVVLIEQNALHLECIGEVQQSLLSIFAGYYLQAASLMNTIGNVRVLERLDTLNPNRSPVNAGLNTWLVASESYENGLPFPSNKKLQMAVESFGTGLGVGSGGSGSGHTKNSPKASGNTAGAMGGMGAGSSHNPATGLGTGQGGQGSGHRGNSGNNKGTAGAMGGMGTTPANQADMDQAVGDKSYGRAMANGHTIGANKADIGRTMTELANLSVGKAYEINISDGQHAIPVQINIRLIASMLPTPDLVHILATGSDDTSFKERWHGWKSGKLGFWKDLVFCNDLIDKRRADLLKDKTGTLTNISRTDLGNTITSVVTGQPSIASSSNMVVLTKDSAENLELQLEGKLSKFEIRQRMMKKTSLMIMAIVDEVDYNTVTFYHRNISMPTTVRIKDLKTSNKGTGPDIGDILKALMGGHAPSL